MNFSVITLFPEMFNAIKMGITGRAIEEKIISLNTINPRDFTKDKHHTVDDRPYGGGPGMVMKVEPLQLAIQRAKETIKDQCKVIYLSPQGKVFKQADAKSFSQQKNLILLSGRYEGIDERLIKHHIDEEWSIGDYVISGGELAAMVMIDSITRLLPGALGHEFSAEYDSFVDGLLDYPHYTRPESINGESVPDVLLSGDHEKIRKYRLKQALGRTWLRRSELIHARIMTQEEQDLLQEFISEMEKIYE